MEQPNLPITGYVRINLILKLIPVGRSSWWQGVKEGRFPQPIKIGPRTTAWRVEDIREWMAKFGKNPSPQTD